jgi:hypothetical protein
MKIFKCITLCYAIFLSAVSCAHAEDSLTVENTQTDVTVFVKHEYKRGPAFDSVSPHNIKVMSRDEVSTACKKDLVCKIDFTYPLANNKEHLLGSVYMDLRRIPMMLVEYDVSYDSQYQMQINMENNHVIIVPR